MQISLKLLTVLILMICLLSTAKSQDTIKLRHNSFGFELQVGYPSNDFKSLTEARDAALSILPFSAKVTDDYPHIPYIQGEALYITKYLEIGVLFSFLTTGSRIHYADYSGEYKYDDVISNYDYGIVLKTKSADENRHFRIQFFGELGAASMVFKSTELHRIGTEATRISDKITNTINFIELGLRPNFYYKGFNFSAGVSYYFELPPDVYFLIEKPIDLNIGFSGVRAHLGVGYKF